MSTESPRLPDGIISDPYINIAACQSREGVADYLYVPHWADKWDDDPVKLAPLKLAPYSDPRHEEINRCVLPILLLLGLLFRTRITYRSYKIPPILLPLSFYIRRIRKGFLEVES